MRAQASIEFIIIIGAIAGFSLFAVGAFTTVLHKQTTLLSGVLNQTSGAVSTTDNYSGNQGNGTQTVSATITRHNESVYYPAGQQTGIYGVQQDWHCIWTSWSGHADPISTQCHTPGWGYFVSSGACPGSATYCFSLNLEGASASPVQYDYSYNYSISLGISDQGTAGSANLTSSDNSSEIKAVDGVPDGTAEVTGVTGQVPEPYDEYAVLNVSNAISLVNASVFNAYIQALGDLENTLSFYNGTTIDTDTQLIINQSIDSFDTAASRLLSAAPAAAGPCAVKDSSNTIGVVCRPLSPLYYQINATVPGIHPNQQILVQGSTLNIS